MYLPGSTARSPEGPLVMGIVNVTPDSFSDGGLYADARSAIAHAHRLAEEGADVLDIGGESTRPGVEPVPLDEELRRVLPVLEGVRGLGVPVSVDTMKPEVMRAVVAAGAAMINDVSGFRAPGAWEAVKDSDCALCVMHMRGEPRTMQAAPAYTDVVGEVEAYLMARMAQAESLGIARERLWLDPGFGFGKTLEHNVGLFRHLHRFTALAPVLVGVSRKSMLGGITGRPVNARMPASVVAAVLAASRGAAMVRVHDVRETVDALKIWRALGQLPGEMSE